MFGLPVLVLIMLHNLSQEMFVKTYSCTEAPPPTPLSIRLAGSIVYSLQYVAYITGVGHYRVVGCTGETALTICGSTRITAVNDWNKTGSYRINNVLCTPHFMYIVTVR